MGVTTCGHICTYLYLYGKEPAELKQPAQSAPKRRAQRSHYAAGSVVSISKSRHLVRYRSHSHPRNIGPSDFVEQRRHILQVVVRYGTTTEGTGFHKDGSFPLIVRAPTRLALCCHDPLRYLNDVILSHHFPNDREGGGPKRLPSIFTR